ncbi:MAG: Ig-like domain-containing protein, partial [Methylococcaceae bacterium]
MSNTSIRTKAATDNTAPKPINSNISNHQQGVPLDTTLSITFDEDIKLGKGFFVISNGLNDTRYIATSYSS